MTIATIDRALLPSISEGVSLFASLEWCAMYGEQVQAYGLFDAAQQLQGSFLLFHKQKLGLGYTITAPFAPHIGLHYRHSSEKLVSQQGHSKDVHRAIASLLNERKDILIEVTLSTEEKDSQPYAWVDFEVQPRHTYLLQLDRTTEELLAAMSPERRKNIRKAEGDGLEIVRTEDAERCLALLMKTIERQDISLDKGILELVLKSEALKSNRAMYICHAGGKDLATSLVVWDEQRSYYLIGGYDLRAAHQGAGTLNLWQAILDAKARGNSIFDFEGSQLPEIERYFRGFGGELHTFFQLSKTSSLGRLAKRVKG